VNLFLRLLWLLIISRLRSPVSPFGPCRTPFRVLPTDLDVLRHVNNGVYLSLMDLARVDLMTRCGLGSRLRAQGWFPVVVAETIQFRRSLTLFQPFVIETRLLGWDDKAFLVAQRFVRGVEPIATAMVRARFLSRAGGTVAPAEVLTLVGVSGVSPPLSEYARRWNADQASWRDEAAGEPAPEAPAV
jgi:acyl-CoA thioesterase FadM